MDCKKRLCENCDFFICEVDGCRNRACFDCDGVKYLEGEEPEFVCDEHIAGYCDECETHVREFFGHCDGCNTLLCYNCDRRNVLGGKDGMKVYCATCPAH